MIITISGNSGTGTTTLSRRLSSTLGFPYFYAGSIFRRIADEHKLKLLDMIEGVGYDSNLDRQVDDEMVQIMSSQKDALVEGRLSGYLAWHHKIPSFRILLTASPATQAERIAQREQKSLTQALAEAAERDNLDWQRYLDLYGIDKQTAPQWYQLILDTDTMDIETVYQTCLQTIQQQHDIAQGKKLRAKENLEQKKSLSY
ncbi:(d)CMP kinase [Candidatus Gracilibacteria bacterium]|nr:(d)CMP kinase [Candidatus Gracilibacteria bacterium]